MIPISLDDTENPNWYAFAPMTDDEKPRSIRFPQSLWDRIDRDAERCKRSAVKQMEAVLSAYYRLADVDISHAALDAMPERDHPRPKTVRHVGPLIDEKKRKTG